MTGCQFLQSQVEAIAGETREQQPYMLRRTGIAAVPGTTSVLMEFEAPATLFELQGKAMEAAQSHSAGLDSSHPFRPAIALLEYGNFPEAILKDAAQFADGVASGLDMTEMALPLAPAANALLLRGRRRRLEQRPLGFGPVVAAAIQPPSLRRWDIGL